MAKGVILTDLYNVEHYGLVLEWLSEGFVFIDDETQEITFELWENVDLRAQD